MKLSDILCLTWSTTTTETKLRKTWNQIWLFGFLLHTGSWYFLTPQYQIWATHNYIMRQCMSTQVSQVVFDISSVRILLLLTHVKMQSLLQKLETIHSKTMNKRTDFINIYTPWEFIFLTQCCWHGGRNLRRANCWCLCR